ncbi:MAG: ATP-binding cassette domain-containing protein [Gammaproteobacteria bacterium]|nr:ATP-binding cassette domain-containing protein [Gammaproteobacteria bacterium]
MLNFSDLSLRRGTRQLLQGVSLTIHARQRVGVTGANGTGKSSLFALIRGELAAEGGSCSLPPHTVIAHVAQETPAVDQAALDYVLDGDRELRDIQRQIAAAEHQHDGNALAGLYERFEVIGAYTASSRAAQLMHGLGFAAEQQNRPVRAFSGGWRMRLNLAQALMCRSDLLLLDEPTNHLDLEAVIWLEEWLRSYPGTLLLISHDRDFLDRIVTHVAHIEQGKVTLYTGNYSAFEVARAQALAGQQSAYEKQQREMVHMQSFVERFRAKASKARQAQSRLKALERLTVIGPAHVDSPFNFSFRPPRLMPNPLLQLREVRAGYAGREVLKTFSMTIAPGDRIGLLGHNGAGKSTLIKLLSGEPLLLSGERHEAKGLHLGYFAQHQLEQLDEQASPLLHLQRLDPKATEQQLRDFLGGFAFIGDQATAAVKPLSGGERARLVLALLVYQRPNLLLLDEPTNHLDLDMRHALSMALQDYQGAMVIVSHDRHLLRTVTDTLWLVANQQVAPFAGDIDDYMSQVRQQGKDSNTQAASADESGSSKRLQRQQAAERRRQLQPLRDQIKALDKKIEGLSHDKQRLELTLGDIALYEPASKERLKQLLAEQQQVVASLQQAEEQWLDLSEQLQQLTDTTEAGE